MGITYGDYRIDCGDYDPPEEGPILCNDGEVCFLPECREHGCMHVDAEETP